MLVEDIVKEIKADILKGKIRSGEKLPSERNLQEFFGVGRSTVREAIRILEGMGIVTIRKGRGGGVFLTDRSQDIVSENLSELFRFEESNIIEFLEFRRTIEPKIVFNAALNRTEENVKKLKESIDLLGKEIQTNDLYVSVTQKFFQAISESTQNPYIIAYYKHIIPVLGKSAKILYRIPKCVDLSLHFFSQIYEAIAGKEPAKGEMISDAYLVQLAVSVKDAKNFGFHISTRTSTIKWGIMLDLTSATLDWGKQCAMGMIDAARYLNETNFIRGKKIELVVQDDKYKLSESQAAYKRFRDHEKVLGLYIQSTGTNLAIAPVAMKDHLFMFSGGTTAKLSNPKNYPYYFSLGPTYSDMARVVIKYVRNTWKIKNRNPRIVFVYPDNVYGRDLLQAGKAYAKELNVRVGPDQIINWPTLDATPQLLSLKQFNPDYVIVTSTTMNAAAILRDSKRLGINTEFICNNRVFTEDLPRLAIGAAEGVLGIQPVAPYGSNVPGMEIIVKCHDKWHPYHEPTLAYVEGWVNILVPMEACKIADNAGKLTSDGIKEVLETFRDFDTGGLVPPLSYFDDDHRATTMAKIYRIEGDELIAITDFIDAGRDRNYFGK